MTRPWPATCATCGKPVRKAESHSGAPGSGISVRHLGCAQPAEPRCKRCEQPTPHRWRGLCARCYIHAGGST